MPDLLNKDVCMDVSGAAYDDAKVNKFDVERERKLPHLEFRQTYTHSYVRTQFEALKNADGFITKAQFLAVAQTDHGVNLEAVTSAPIVEATAESSPVVVPLEEVATAEDAESQVEQEKKAEEEENCQEKEPVVAIS